MGAVFVAAGSNLSSGEISPLDLTRGAGDSLVARGRRLVRTSSFYRNPAWPPGSDAPDYVNAVYELEATGSPASLLADLHEIEAEAGRTRGVRYQSRTLDLDLVAWGDLVVPDLETARRWIEAEEPDRAAVPARLIVPHPRLHERAFVLVPLAEIAPGWRHPVLGRTAREMCEALPATELAALSPV